MAGDRQKSAGPACLPLHLAAGPFYVLASGVGGRNPILPSSPLSGADSFSRRLAMYSLSLRNSLRLGSSMKCGRRADRTDQIARTCRLAAKIEGRPKGHVCDSTGRDGDHAASNCGRPVSNAARAGAGANPDPDPSPDPGPSVDGRPAAPPHVHLRRRRPLPQFHRECRFRRLEHRPLPRSGELPLQGPLPRQYQTSLSRRIADP